VGESALDVGVAEAMLLELGDGDAMQRRVHLAVTTAVEPHALGVARPDGHRCGAV
jgi:hypothetical protein